MKIIKNNIKNSTNKNNDTIKRKWVKHIIKRQKLHDGDVWEYIFLINILAKRVIFAGFHFKTLRTML